MCELVCVFFCFSTRDGRDDYCQAADLSEDCSPSPEGGGVTAIKLFYSTLFSNICFYSVMDAI